MMSKIQWTQQTWNPIVGCTRVSPGCQHCYAERMAKRLIAMGQEKYNGTIDTNGRWTGFLNFDIDNWDAPVKRQKPTTYFVNSMSDLFHADVPPNWLMRIWSVMTATPQHTYQILTKRANILEQRGKWLADVYGVLPNVWFGVSVENQEYADERIPYLLKTPAAVRFLSCEPLLGSVDIGRWLCCPWCGKGQIAVQDEGGTWYHPDRFGGMPCPTPKTGRGNAVHNIDWVIVGGESGPGARLFQLDLARSLVSQCKAADIPVFVKQLGACAVDDNCTYPTKDRKGGNPDEWPEELRVREFPLINTNERN